MTEEPVDDQREVCGEMFDGTLDGIHLFCCHPKGHDGGHRVTIWWGEDPFWYDLD